MSCVNIKSKEFKQLMDETGISSENLEVAVHKYQNDRGGTDAYPSLDYIQAYFTGANNATGEAQINVWESFYSDDLVFNTEELLNEARQEALKYFEEGAITTWTNTQGKKVMRVAPPSNSKLVTSLSNESKLVKNKNFDEELNKKLEETFKNLYPEVELNYTESLISEDIRLGIEAYKEAHPDVVTVSSKESREEALKNLENIDIKGKVPLQFQISKKRRLQFDKYLEEWQNVLDIKDWQVKAFFKYANTFDEIDQQEILFKWFINGAINVKEDAYKIEAAFEFAKKYKLKLFDYNSPMAIINIYGVREVEEHNAKLDLDSNTFKQYDTIPGLSNKRIEGNTVVYDVADSKETAKIISEFIVSKFFDVSPWCIFQFDRKAGGAVWGGEYWWDLYSAQPRKIAFDSTGKPIGMFASKESPTWWNTEDREQFEIPQPGYLTKYGIYVEDSRGTKGDPKNGEFRIYKIDTADNIFLKRIQRKSAHKLHGWQEYYSNNNSIKYITKRLFKQGSFTGRSIEQIYDITIEKDYGRTLKIDYGDSKLGALSQQLLPNVRPIFVHSEYPISEAIEHYYENIIKLKKAQTLLKTRKKELYSYVEFFNNNTSFDAIMRNMDASMYLSLPEKLQKVRDPEDLLISTKFKTEKQAIGFIKHLVYSEHKRLINRANSEVKGAIKGLFSHKNHLNAVLYGYAHPEEAKNGQPLKFEEEEELPFQIEDGVINGVYDPRAVAILINLANRQQDTLPHEYAHHYIKMFRNAKIVQEGFKRFGGEENLVQAIGEQVVKQKGEAANWWNKFISWIKGLFNRDQYIVERLANALLQRETLKLANALDSVLNPALNVKNAQIQYQKEETNESIENRSQDILNEEFPNIDKLPNEIDAFSKNTTTTKTGESQQAEDEAFLKKQNKLVTQLNALTDNSLLTSSEVRDIAEQVVYAISDHITELIKNPQKIKEVYGIGDNIDVNTATRLEIINAIGADNILNYAKELFKPRAGRYEKRSTSRKANLIYNNWLAITTMANNVFGTIENFTLVTADGVSKAEEQQVTDVDNYNSSNDKDNIAETEGSLQEHWQIESRTLDVLASMSALVKQELAQCHVLFEIGKDENGNPTYDAELTEFGIKKRIKIRDAVNSILRWTQGSTDLPTMIAKLDAKKDKNPWITQILDKLKDDSGLYSDFQSQFYSVMTKHHQVYSIVTKVDGKYVSKPINVDPAMTQVLDHIVATKEIGQHPLFNTAGINISEFNKLGTAIERLASILKDLKEPTSEQASEIISILTYASNALGYDVTAENVADIVTVGIAKNMLDSLRFIYRILDTHRGEKDYDPFGFKGGIRGNLNKFLSPLIEHLEDIAPSCFYDSGKMYQNYVTPSYITVLMNKFHDEEHFVEFMQKEYGQYPWFRDQKTRDTSTGWRNSWLREIMNNKKAREVFAHKVQLHFDKDSYMRGLTPEKYTLSLISEYFSEFAGENKTRVPAWFRIPIMSNKPSSEFIRFYSERGVNYKTVIIDGVKNIFDQELTRIQSVRSTNYSSNDPNYIQNFDKNGKIFQFLDWMNEYLDGSKKNSELGKLINKKVEGKKLTPDEEALLLTESKKVIGEYMQERANKILTNWEQNGVLKEAKKIQNVGENADQVRASLENFIWNDFYASNMILELTIIDKAYYKNEDDLQKRLAQIHSPGVRGNIHATDYYGNLVSDGVHRSVILTDFDKVKSNIIDNLRIIFDRKIEAAPEHLKEGYKVLKENILSQFEEINSVDGQAYNSPTSYRKKAFIFGKWSREAEELYNKIKAGNYTYDDLKLAFQPLKPFVYGAATKFREDGGLLDKLKVGMQYKNSEYLLILADAIIGNENTGKPNLLRAIYEVMEESAAKKPTKGIDTFQFESAVKVGIQNKVDLTPFEYIENGEKAAKEALEAAIYDAEGNYNLTTVNELPFSAFAIQQEVPAHFRDHEQIDGSQKRYAICSDLETFYDGKEVLYKVDGKTLTADQFKAEYEKIYAENIKESLDELVKDLRLTGTRKERNIALSKILQESITSRDGIDLIVALSLNENGEFRMPIGEPTQLKRIEQLINSVIKNRINKQTLPGGPVVQVTSFGLSKRLSIRFKDKNNEGALLITKAEFEKSDKYNPEESLDTAFLNYLKENQGGIAYYEALVPITSNKLFEKFANKDGSIDIKAIEAVAPDLLKMIGYRIPTEDKYSCFPIKVVGFLPREAGEGLMLPDEITEITDSDFK